MHFEQKEKKNIYRKHILSQYGLNNKVAVRFFISGICDIIMINIAFRVYLPGFAIFANATDVVISILSSLFICNFMANIFSPYVYSKFKNRNRTIIFIQLMALFFLNMVVIIPLFIKGTAVGYIILAFTFVGMLLYGIFLSGYTIWVMTSIDKEKRATYISIRESTARIVCIIAVIILSIIIDKLGKGYIGFVIIYSVSFIIGIVENIYLRKIMKDSKKIESKEIIDNKKLSLKKSIKIAWTNIVYRKICIGYALIFFIAWICYPLRNLYMLKYLGMSYTSYSIILNLWFVLQAIFTIVWTKISHKIGWKKILYILTLFYCAEYLCWVFVTRGSIFMLVPVYIFSGIANSGLPLAMLNGRYEYMPDENKIAYESFYNLLIGTAWLLGLILGNILRNIIPVPKVAFFGGTNIQIMFFISFVAGVIYFIYSKKYLFNIKVKTKE